MDTKCNENINQFDFIVFDMDGTLAKSKGKISENMAFLINKLLSQKKVAIISGGRWQQFEKQLLLYLDTTNFDKLYILPTSGSSLMTFIDNSWKENYSENIPEDERNRISKIINNAIDILGYKEKETWGDVVEDRISQVTFSALGSLAPFDKKNLWDPNQEKRLKIVNFISQDLQNYSIGIGGTNSIDITIKGIDKAYGVKKLSEFFKVPLSRILFIGDKLDEGGNDYPVKKLGITTIAVVDENETEHLLNKWLN